MGNVNFKKIMIATDGSICSRMAANKGIELARLSGGTVYAVYVVSTEYFSSMGVDFYWGKMYKALKKEGQQAVNYIKDLGEMEKVNVESILLEGHPADELIRYAEEEEMDIVIKVSTVIQVSTVILAISQKDNSLSRLSLPAPQFCGIPSSLSASVLKAFTFASFCLWPSIFFFTAAAAFSGESVSQSFLTFALLRAGIKAFIFACTAASISSLTLRGSMPRNF